MPVAVAAPARGNATEISPAAPTAFGKSIKCKIIIDMRLIIHVTSFGRLCEYSDNIMQRDTQQVSLIECLPFLRTLQMMC